MAPVFRSDLDHLYFVGRTILWSRKFQHLYNHVLRSERVNTVSITSYQMTKGPELHNAQQSLTDLIQSSTKVNIDMHANKTSHTIVPQTKPSHDLYYWYVPQIKGRGGRAGCCHPHSPSLRRRWRSARGLGTMGTYSSDGKYNTDCDSNKEEDDPEYWWVGESQER